MFPLDARRTLLVSLTLHEGCIPAASCNCNEWWVEHSRLKFDWLWIEKSAVYCITYLYTMSELCLQWQTGFSVASQPTIRQSLSRLTKYCTENAKTPVTCINIMVALSKCQVKYRYFQTKLLAHLDLHFQDFQKYGWPIFPLLLGVAQNLDFPSFFTSLLAYHWSNSKLKFHLVIDFGTQKTAEVSFCYRFWHTKMS